MAKTDIQIPAHLQYRYKSDYEFDWDIHRQYITTFDPLEAMLIGVVYDSVSNSVDNARITDSYATTLAKERADRVMAKLPDGQTESMGRGDMGKAQFMDIMRQKWVYPNANAQHSFREKLNMWTLYGDVYGYMPMFYDWNVSHTGYVGPDCWLWNPRNLIPQSGRASIREMEYVTALTWVAESFIQEMVEQNGGEVLEPTTAESGDTDADQVKTNEGGWDVEALELLLQVAKNSSNPDATRDTKVVRERTPQPQKRGICLATRYEAGPDGEWVVFAPDHGCIEVRRLKNPHKNGRIPFVILYSQPLFDSFYGLGDLQRSKPIQFARDGLTNFYFEGIKMNLIPPLVANANGVLKHTLDYRAGSVMLETIPNSIRRLETSTAGLATYQGAQDALTGSLLSLFGSQNASVSAGAALNPEQGKTPQAINLYADKEATRDGAARRHLEDAIEQLTEGFFSLVANIGTEDVPIQLFRQDIEMIVKQGLADVTDIFDKKQFKLDEKGLTGTLTIDPSKMRGIEFRFKIDPNSTAEVNKQAQLQSITDFLKTVSGFQNIFQEDERFDIHWDDILNTYEQMTGIPNASKFITFDPSKPSPAQVQSQLQTQQQQTPSGSSVQMPNGQVHELADLGKLYLNTSDWWVKNQILQAMGFQPAPPEVQQQIPASEPGGDKQNDPGVGIDKPGPTSISSGHMFNDPHVAAAAEAINGFQPNIQPTAQPEAAPEEPQLTVAKTGHAFNDPAVAQASDAINNFPQPKMNPNPYTAAKPA
jgi:hypothetical protein